MTSEQTRAYLSFALVGLMFVLVIALFFVEMPRENSTLLNTALGFLQGLCLWRVAITSVVQS